LYTDLKKVKLNNGEFLWLDTIISVLLGIFLNSPNSDKITNKRNIEIITNKERLEIWLSKSDLTTAKEIVDLIIEKQKLVS